MTTVPNDSGLASALRVWFRPPRAHGEVIEDRVVSPLELFYDLVFVVLISQIAHTLADDVSWEGVGHFTAVFTLVWFAWLNGSLYHELHGGNDGRSRSYIFAQMLLLVVVAVYVGHAADDSADGRGFAVAYTILLGLLTTQWADVRRRDDAMFAALTKRYVASLVLVGAAVGASAFVDEPATRVWVWVAAMSVAALVVVSGILRNDPAIERALRVTESLSERFGLFIIIVLGEVVVGVVGGLTETDRSARTIATGLLALGISFGFWWTYFDFAGRRIPRPGPRTRAVWMFSHFPLALATAAVGAGMVGLVEHAGASRTPEPTAWLIGGGTAVLASSLALIVAVMDPHPARRLVPVSLGVVAALSVVLAAFRPAPWLLAAGLDLAFTAAWFDAFVRHVRTGLPVAKT
jgi:low temperature requirement protein LtrA